MRQVLAQGPVMTTLAAAAAVPPAPAAVAAAAVALETRAWHQRDHREEGLGRAPVLVSPLLPALPQRDSCLVLLLAPVLRRFQS